MVVGLLLFGIDMVTIADAKDLLPPTPIRVISICMRLQPFVVVCTPDVLTARI